MIDKINLDTEIFNYVILPVMQKREINRITVIDQTACSIKYG